MHHVKFGITLTGWLYLYVDGYLMARCHMPSAFGAESNINTRLLKWGNHVTEDGTYIWGRPNGENLSSSGFTPNTLEIGCHESTTGTAISRNVDFMYSDIRVSSHDIDTNLIRIPYVRKALPRS